jgi:hypothetical protein
MWPIRSWRNSAGPGETNFTHAAVSNPKGSQTGIVRTMRVQSKIRFHDGTRARAIRSETLSTLSCAEWLSTIEFI